MVAEGVHGWETLNFLIIFISYLIFETNKTIYSFIVKRVLQILCFTLSKYYFTWHGWWLILLDYLGNYSKPRDKYVFYAYCSHVFNFLFKYPLSILIKASPLLQDKRNWDFIILSHQVRFMKYIFNFVQILNIQSRSSKDTFSALCTIHKHTDGDLYYNPKTESRGYSYNYCCHLQFSN